MTSVVMTLALALALVLALALALTLTVTLTLTLTLTSDLGGHAEERRGAAHRDLLLPALGP